VIKVLHVTNLYPTEDHPENLSYGVFVKEQIDSLNRREGEIACDLVYIDARQRGKRQYLLKIPEIIRMSRDFDLVHCHHTYSAFATLMTGMVRRPVITSFTCPRGEEGRSSRFRTFKKLMHDVSRVRSVCFIEKTSSSVEDRYPGRGFYIPNGVNLDFFRETPREASWNALRIPPRRYILFVSSGGVGRREKRHDLFREVVRILREKEGEDVDGLLLVNEEREKVPLFFNAARVHLLTSDSEGSPNSVKEALACNVPVVSTNVGNVAALVGGVPGCYVSATNKPGELAELVSKAMRQERVRGREAIVRLGLDTDSTADRLMEVYSHALDMSG